MVFGYIYSVIVSVLLIRHFNKNTVNFTVVYMDPN